MIFNNVDILIKFFGTNRPIIVLSIMMLVSCVGQREVEYLQDKDKSIKIFPEAEFSDYTLKPNDELYVNISSLDEGAANVFTSGSGQSSLNMVTTPFGASMMSYPVDKEGYLLLPIVGSVFVNGKTLSQVSNILKDSLHNVLNQPVVNIKLVNRYVSVLGEVRNPGHFSFSQERLSIYDALGLAGDITDYGDRNSLVLIRSNNGENLRVNIDLTKSDLLSSGFYNVRPNDIIYVKPLRKKFWGMRQFPYQILFSTITTALLVYNVFYLTNH